MGNNKNKGLESNPMRWLTFILVLFIALQGVGQDSTYFECKEGTKYKSLWQEHLLRQEGCFSMNYKIIDGLMFDYDSTRTLTRIVQIENGEFLKELEIAEFKKDKNYRYSPSSFGEE